MSKQPSYIPPFTVSADAINLIAEISAQIERYAIRLEQEDGLRLRKANRIKTIHSSLAIEGNMLSEDEVRDIVDGKNVVAPIRQIQEVKNAIDAYELLLELNPYKEKDLLRAHKLMMTDLVNENGRYRQGGVGVFDGQKCIHMAPPAQRVPLLMADLLGWAKQTKVHPLVSSCVFHYEFEFIHPFADGNGRMGRMWQTLLLMQWKPIFAWIPVETIVKEHQKDYYAAIAKSDSEANSTAFITFMLQCLKQALQEMEESNQKSKQKSDQKILSAMRRNPSITIRELQEETGLSESGVKKIIRQLKADGLISRVGGDKGGHWEIL